MQGPPMPARRTGPAAQLFRYGLIGLATNLLGYLAFVFLVASGTEPKMAMTFLYAVGVAVGYVGNRQWTFAHTGSWAASMTRYGLAHLLGYMLNFLILVWFIDRLGHPAHWVQAGAIIVVAGFLFLAFRYFAFRAAKGDGGE